MGSFYLDQTNGQDISITEMLTALVCWKQEHNTSTQQAICDQRFLSIMYNKRIYVKLKTYDPKEKLLCGVFTRTSASIIPKQRTFATQ